MTTWIVVALLGGVVGLDTTSFPQVMVSRPVVAGALTGALFGRPFEGIVLGFIMEVYALVTLPIGASRYPDSGTAAVAATAAYLATVPIGLDTGPLLVAVAFGLAWGHIGGETVVLQRRGNGRVLARDGTMAGRELERRHLGAMSLDFLRGGVVAVTGGLIGAAALPLTVGQWGFSPGATWGVVTVLLATMIGATLPLFGGARVRRLALALGVAVGLLVAVTL